LRAHPGKSLIVALFIALLGGIVANAVVLQKGHHPAPLFASAPSTKAAVVNDPVAPPAAESRPPSDRPAAADPPSPPQRSPAAAPAVPGRPSDASVSGAKPDGIGAFLRSVPKPSPPAAPTRKPEAVADAAPTPAAAPPTSAAVSRPPLRPIHRGVKPDAITTLLGEPAKLRPASSTAKFSAPEVLNAQRALAKLGYEVHATGTMDAATHRAILRFERERHGTRGDDAVTLKILREIGALTGRSPG
jgi:hypothetical protein